METFPGFSVFSGSLLRDLELKRLISGSVSADAWSGIIVVGIVLLRVCGDVNACVDVMEHAQTTRATDVENFIIWIERELVKYFFQTMSLCENRYLHRVMDNGCCLMLSCVTCDQSYSVI